MRLLWTTLLLALTWAVSWAWIVAHQLALFYGFNFLVDQLPEPVGPGTYKYIFMFLHALAANWNGRVIPAAKKN